MSASNTVQRLRTAATCLWKTQRPLNGYDLPPYQNFETPMVIIERKELSAAHWAHTGWTLAAYGPENDDAYVGVAGVT